jgi:hypothetical protein
LTQQEGITEKEWVMEKLSRIEWLPLYSVNNEEIDAQHRKLFDITNHLMDLFERDAGDRLCHRAFSYRTYGHDKSEFPRVPYAQSGAPDFHRKNEGVSRRLPSRE